MPDLRMAFRISSSRTTWLLWSILLGTSTPADKGKFSPTEMRISFFVSMLLAANHASSMYTTFLRGSVCGKSGLGFCEWLTMLDGQGGDVALDVVDGHRPLPVPGSLIAMDISPGGGSQQCRWFAMGTSTRPPPAQEFPLPVESWKGCPTAAALPFPMGSRSYEEAAGINVRGRRRTSGGRLRFPPAGGIHRHRNWVLLATGA